VEIIKPQSFLFVHLTDPHIGAPGTYERFKDVLQHVNTLNPDGVIISGDLVDWGCLHPTYLTPDIGALNYQDFNLLIKENLDKDVKVYTCPGNHDYRYGKHNWLGGWEWYYLTWNPTLWPPGLFDFHLLYSLQNYHKYINQNNRYENGGDNYYTTYKNTLLISLDSGHDTWDPSWESIYDAINHFQEIISGDWTWADEYLRGTGLSSGQINDLNEWLSFPKDNKIVFMHHPAVNPVRTITNHRSDFIDTCERNGVEVVLTGHTHNSIVYDKDGNWYKPYDDKGNDIPLHSNEIGKTLYLQTEDCGPDHASYREIEIYGDDVIIHMTKRIHHLVNLYLTGPADIHGFDSKGNHLGINNDGEPESEIHGATYGYLETGEEFASVYYGQDDYKFSIEAIENGIITLTLKILMKNGGCTNIEYENVPITNHSKGILYVYRNSVDYSLYLDNNNDGKVDAKVQPTNISYTFMD